MNVKLVAVLLVLIMCIPVASVCRQAASDDGVDTGAVNDSNDVSTGSKDVSINSNYGPTREYESLQGTIAATGAAKGDYNEGVVLVKDSSFDVSKLETLEYVSSEPLYSGSSWQIITLDEGVDTAASVEYLRSLGVFEQVDYDYVMGADGTVESIGVTDNPSYSSQTYLQSMGIEDGWLYLDENGMNPGGSSDVIVAVIDTGVDYNHIDLRNNIWINTAEIPGNGIDDDGNGYIDDVYGWDFVGNDADPMDDNGHGTHVAGIIAAENNSIGTVGVAYNCKVMVLKAGNSSGYFNNSAIAQAIQYAYMNGASVINMSFGGSSISLAVEDALESAYYQCVLVAAAGNNGLCNNLSHASKHDVGVFYPAALSYVMGVMSCDFSGATVSSFSNYDDTPFDTVEYEVFACGERVLSTWPGNKESILSGTSMAAPVISGVAALLRSLHPDRELFSTKYIQSQIIDTGVCHPFNSIAKSLQGQTCVNAYNALATVAPPDVKIYDYFTYDAELICEKNNGNGILDSGESILLGIILKNHGGVATNVSIKCDSYRDNSGLIEDPYVDFISSELDYGNIGIYSTKSLEDGEQLNEKSIANYIQIKIADDCPNDYNVVINVHILFWDELGQLQYGDDYSINLSIYRGQVLPRLITEDLVLTSDNQYILMNNMVIDYGVTVTIEPGTHIQYYASSYEKNASPPEYLKIMNNGTLICEGTSDSYIVFEPSEICSNLPIDFSGYCYFKYTKLVNFCYDANSTLSSSGHTQVDLDHCIVTDNSSIDRPGYYANDFGNVTNTEFRNIKRMVIYSNSIENCLFTEWCVDNWNIHGGEEARGLRSNYFKGNVFYDTYPSYAMSCHVINIASADSADCFTNNVLLYDPNLDVQYSLRLQTLCRYNVLPIIDLSDNLFIGNVRPISEYLLDYSWNGLSSMMVTSDSEACLTFEYMYPFISDVKIFGAGNEVVNKLGAGKYSVNIYFSMPMDISAPLTVTYGTSEPYSDHLVNGEYISEYLWQGNIVVRTIYDDGTQILSVNGGQSATDATKSLRFDRTSSFEINLTGALSMNLQAVPSDTGIMLSWIQDDYDTLMGYNVYRSDDKDGNYVKLNEKIIPSNESQFIDVNAEPGKLYWYTFTVVFSDFTESMPAGKVDSVAKDTILPTIYHVPVNQAYQSNNLVISCTASDNVAVSSVELYYRTIGGSSWKSLPMSKQNDRYSATIFGSDVTLAGLEYYLVVSDGVNTISKGTSDAPYSIIVKDASALSLVGDVDGDGTITTKDALMIMQVLNGDLLLSDDQFKRADLNGNGVLSSSEALRILQYINGNVTTLAMA